MTATAIEPAGLVLAGGTEYRTVLEAAIREVRGELGTSAAAKGLVWQEMRDRWAALVRHHRALYGLPVALQGDGRAKDPPGWQRLVSALPGDPGVT